jgi:hypothetical protein
MQCILYKIYFWNGFSYVPQIDMHFICTPMWTKFYSCKKWVLHLTPSLMSMTPYLTPHRRFPPAESRRHWLPCMVSPAVPFRLRRVPYPSLMPPRTTLPPSSWVMAGISRQTTSGEWGVRSPLFLIWADQFWPRGTVWFFFFPNDLFKFN